MLRDGHAGSLVDSRVYSHFRKRSEKEDVHELTRGGHRDGNVSSAWRRRFATGLSFVGRSGARVSAGFVQGRFPVLTLHDEDGKARAMMGVSPDGAPRLDLVDQDGVVIWKAP
jgi:hypothetical protein